MPDPGTEEKQNGEEMQNTLSKVSNGLRNMLSKVGGAKKRLRRRRSRRRKSRRSRRRRKSRRGGRKKRRS